MNTHSKTLMWIFLSLIFIPLHAQNKAISGKVQNEGGEGIANALVLLSDTLQINRNQAEYVDILETDSLGQFTISGQHTFNKIFVNRIGYQPLEISYDSQRFLNIVMVANEDYKLEEVQVKGYRQAVKMNTSGLVYDMKYSPIKQGSMMDALRFIPMVHLDKGTIQIIGKSDVKYFLNGKELKLEANALNAYIQSLSADDIEKIEVITSHDPRFHADFNQGSINIVTKRQENEGWRGNAQASLWKTHYVKGSGNLQLSYARKKFSANFFLTGSHLSTWRELESATLYKSNNEKTSKEGVFDGRDSNIDFHGLFNYSLTQNSSLSGNINVGYVKRNQSEYGIMEYLTATNSSPYAEITHDNLLKSDVFKIKAGLIYQHSFKNKCMFRSSVNFYRGDVESSILSVMDSVSNGIAGNPHEHYKEILPQKSSVWSGDVLYMMPAGQKTNVAFELNAFHWKIDNDDRYWRLTHKDWELDRRMSNHLKVKEWTAQGVFSMRNTWSKKFQSVVGIGMQRRRYQSEEIHTKSRSDQSFWQPAPFLMLSVNQGGKFSANYSADYRTVNPTFAQMNPFKWYTSATTYQTGNPNLSQEKFFSQSLVFQFFQHFMLFAGHKYADDVTVHYNTVKEDGMIESRPENMASYHESTLYLSVNNLSYWKNRGNFRTTAGWVREWYRAAIPQSDDPYKRVTDSYFVQLNNSTTFFPSWPIQMVNSLSYNSKRKSDFTTYPASVNFYTSLQKNIKNWRFNLNVSVNSFLYGWQMKLDKSYTLDNSDLRIFTTDKGESVSFGLQISYSFGNMRVKSIRRANTTSGNLENRLER